MEVKENKYGLELIDTVQFFQEFPTFEKWLIYLSLG